MSEKKKKPWLFKPGQSGNTAGKPKGTRNKLGEDFLTDLHADWQKHGKEAIAATRENEPGVYLKVVAGILPKETHHRHFLDDLKELTAEQLQQRLERVRKERSAMIGENSQNQGETTH